MSTPSQTVGPFFSHALPWPEGPVVVPDGDVWLRGTVYDGAGEPVPDALVETWQADADGRYDGDFRSFGRCPTDPSGAWAIRTVKPGTVKPGTVKSSTVKSSTGDGQAPHVAVSVFARGLLHRLVTRIYFADEAEANAADGVLAAVDPARRDTLIARSTADGYALDIHLQGERETVFFDV